MSLEGKQGGPPAYDTSGNMTNDGSHSYTFDAENRLATGAGVTYTYDGDDWRTKKSSGQLEWHDTTDDGNLLDEFDSSGNLQAEFYYIGSMLFASRSFYYFGDNVNSIRIMTDTTGVVKQETDYYAFGGELDVIANSGSNRKFTSKKRDSETGLDYSHHRAYNSTLGRWNTTDPVNADSQKPQTLNAYGYVRNNPVNHKDMSGAFEDDDDRPDKNDARGSFPYCSGPMPAGSPPPPLAFGSHNEPLADSNCYTNRTPGNLTLIACWGKLGKCFGCDSADIPLPGTCKRDDHGVACVAFHDEGCTVTVCPARTRKMIPSAGGLCDFAEGFPEESRRVCSRPLPGPMPKARRRRGIRRHRG